MIKIKKDFTTIPSILKKSNREEAFNNNITAAKYIDDKNLYKVASVQNELNKIYHLKCAYCEQKLLDSPKHIEHYRPKDIYYWLSYSWDNLLLSCGSCNSSKGKKFKIKNTSLIYNNELFSDIHTLSYGYDEIEEPYIINPEKVDILEKLIFDNEAKISSLDEKIIYTINGACKLNRKELLEKRISLLNDFINSIKEHYLLYSIKGDLTRFIPEIKQFKKKCSIESEFYSFRYFILNNIEVFFENKIIQKILKGLIKKLD